MRPTDVERRGSTAVRGVARGGRGGLGAVGSVDGVRSEQAETRAVRMTQGGVGRDGGVGESVGSGIL